jgi:hypothetical protein
VRRSIQGGAEHPAVPLAAEDFLTAIPSVHDVIIGSRKFSALGARHEAETDRNPAQVNQLKWATLAARI